MGVGVVVNTNVPSIHASRVLARNRGDLEQAMERLASGKRINSAADDAAGSAVAAKMHAQVQSLNVAVRNINDGISLLHTYDGAASEIESMVVRMRELAVQASNGTYDKDTDLKYADAEYQALKTQIADIASDTKFNGQTVSNISTAIKINTGPLSSGASEVEVTTDSLDVTSAASKVESQTDAKSAVGTLDTALNALALARAKVGALINRFDHALSNAQNQSQRLTEALSGIEDADYATESANLARGMVLAQAGTAMLAQANQSPQYILTLLRD